jgi:hypothetical protein
MSEFMAALPDYDLSNFVGQQTPPALLGVEMGIQGLCSAPTIQKKHQGTLEKRMADISLATIAEARLGEIVLNMNGCLKEEWCHEYCNATRSMGRDAAPAGGDQPLVR